MGDGLSRQALGMLIAGAGVLALSFDALLVRLAGVGPWEVAVWRGVFIALSLAVVAGWLGGWQRAVRAPLGPLLGASLMFGLNGLLFVLAVMHTAVANVVVILSIAPLFAAACTRLFLREGVAAHTWVAMVVAVIAVGTVFAGSLDGDGLLGDAFALGAAIVLGGNFTLLRRFPQVPRLPTVSLGGAVTALLAWTSAAPWGLAAESYAVLALMGLVQMPLALGLLATATRYITSPEVSLFMLVEMVLAPVWVAAWLGESPSPQTLVAGGLLLTTLAVHSVLALRRLPHQPTPTGRT
ncbi:DMT family transporter [Alkalilimnicola ehrlichii MLHE-1]|uniref:Uncharacterized protein n=1 Tax=Alkalilimnicola ehrlichii (strain ATCC BAA-1101 / DSM 17681 / MLHE-1) TaxID=187272 RepID=Q0A5G6_ALKEH|nr:DMT family transporter [Alkalilimnicola ehrlichii]ABI57921.1 conserved hypothetical protein [Alkalilimnicola ehrlichii MLHE-1]